MARMNALDGIRVLDLSRVLAGPWCTQNLADLGADVIKIERPGTGDDTRTWGPPFLKDRAGQDTAEAAYYLGTNRNKRSVTCDIARPEGQALVRERGMVHQWEHPLAGPLNLVGSPLKLSGTPVRADHPPPLLGQHTQQVLAEVLGWDPERIAQLRAQEII